MVSHKSTATDEELAAELLQLFLQHPAWADGIVMNHLRRLLACSFGRLRAIIRSHPAEFALFYKKGKAHVMCLAAGVQAVSGLHSQSVRHWS